MLLALSSDQEFFRETTGRFLADRAPVAEVRRLRDDPQGFDRRLLAPRRRAGLDLAAGQRGARRRHRSAATALVDLTLVAHEFGRHAAPGPLVPTNVVAAALSDAGDRRPRRAAGRPARGHVDRDVVLRRAAARRPPRRPSRSRSGVDGAERRAQRHEATGRVRRPGRPPPGHRPHRRRADPGAGARRHARRHRSSRCSTVDLTRRFSTVRFDDVRVPADAVVGEVGGAADQVERQLQLALVDGSTPRRSAPCRRPST